LNLFSTFFRLDHLQYRFISGSSIYVFEESSGEKLPLAGGAKNIVGIFIVLGQHPRFTLLGVN